MTKIDSLKVAQELYDKLTNWKESNKYISKFFDENKLNKDQKKVLIKIILIDSLYGTNLFRSIHPIKLMNHIADNNEILDKQIKKGDIKAIETIINNGAENRIISFASKFCHFSNKKEYLIYDSYACLVLNKKLSFPKSCKDYNKFKEGVIKIGNIIKTKDLDEIDKFLWLYGMKLQKEIDKFKEKGGKKIKGINKEVNQIFKENAQLYESLK